MRDEAGRPAWAQLAKRRRMCLGGGVLGTAAVAARLFARTLPAGTPLPLLVGLGLLFFLLFALRCCAGLHCRHFVRFAS